MITLQYASAVLIAWVCAMSLGWVFAWVLGPLLDADSKALVVGAFASVMAAVGTFAYCLDLAHERYDAAQFWAMTGVAVVGSEAIRRVVKASGKAD